MSFWRQLRFLLWKNFLIRRRQKVWIAIELIWPLALFLVLVWVRTRNVYEQIQECHYPAKAMPSAGFLPFLQSYFCTLQNQCSRTALDDDEIGLVNDYDYSILQRAGNFVQNVLNQEELMNEFDEVINRTIEMTRVVDALNATDFNDPLEMLQVQLAMMDSSRKLMAAMNQKGIKALLETLLIFERDNSTVEGDNFVQKFTCGQHNNTQGVFRLPSYSERMAARIFGKAPPRVRSRKKSRFSDLPGTMFTPEENATYEEVCQHYKVEPTLDEKCMEWLRTFSMPRAMIVPIYALLRGFIIVTPRNELTERIVRKLELWLQGFEWAKEAVIDFYLNAEVYQNALANSTIATTYWFVLDVIQKCTSPECVRVNETLWQYRGLFVNSSHPNATLPRLKKRVGNVAFMLQCFLTDRFRFAKTEHQMEEDGMCLLDLDNNKFYTGLYFDVNDTDTQLPLITTYKIRMAEYLVDSGGSIVDRVIKLPRDRPFVDLKYSYFGFSFLQDAIDRAIIELQTNKSQDVGVYSQQFPYPCYQIDGFMEAIRNLLPLIMVMAWVFSASLVVKNVVYEKEMRLKEFMKVMGLENLVHWVAWFVQSFVMIFFSVIVFVVVIKFGRVIQWSSFGVLTVFVLLFNVAAITQCFLISTLFGKANIAAACAALIYFALYLPFVVLTRFTESLSFEKIMPSYLSAQVAFAWGCVSIAEWESVTVGVNWDNVNSSPSKSEFTLALSLGMMVVDTFVHVLLTWYVEAVFPGEYGIPRPFYFPFTKSYWCGYSQNEKTSEPLSEIAPELKKFMEAEPAELPLGVAVRRLKKVYSNGKVALSGVSLNFYESQITSFLGHNGAGKTTTLSILTGLFPPTEGTVLVYGKDVRKQINEVRKSLGMCPQHNILYDMLTVKEQLTFYAGLKGVPLNRIERQVKEMVEELGLTSKANINAEDLSGGTQRRLAVAAAFIGGSKTVVLDEPTAGVDPCARRLIWDLLLRKKEGRTIILSTHFMDEADVLGDRIAIIGDGRLKCCGSSMFLKKCYGGGYRLTMVRSNPSPYVVTSQSSPEADGERSPSLSAKPSAVAAVSPSDVKLSERGVDVNQPIDSFITKALPGSELVEDLRREFTYKLPSENPSSLHQFFVELESKMKGFGISSYGVSETKLEEIFIKAVGKEGGSEKKKSKWPKCCRALRQRFARWRRGKRNQAPIDDVNLLESSSEDDSDKKPQSPSADRRRLLYESTIGPFVLARHLRALLTKRSLNFLRNIKGAFCEIVAPIVMFAIVLYFLGFKPSMPASGGKYSLPLVPWWYKPPLYVFQRVDDPAPDVNWDAKRYLSAMIEPPGLGIRCAQNQSFEEQIPCEYGGTPINITLPPTPFPPRNACRCDDRSVYVCPRGTYQPEPPRVLTNTTDYLVDMTGQNISEWLLMTEEEYRGDRFGGYSLGELNIAAVENLSWPTVDRNVDGMLQKFRAFSKRFNLDWDTGHRTPMQLINSSFLEQLNSSARFKFLLHGLQVRSNVKIWFNNQGWIALPSYASIFSNAVLRANLPNSSDFDPTKYGILVYNHPMNSSSRAQADQLTAKVNMVRLSFEACIIILAFSIVPASFVLFVIEEEVAYSKHLQLISGVRPWMYWVSNFIWDMINFLLPVLGCMITLFIFKDDAYVGWARSTFATFSLLFLYGFATIPFMYPFSFLIRIPSLAFIMLTMGNAFIGWVSTITTMALDKLSEEDEELGHINDLLKVIFLMFPQFCFGRGLLDLKQAYYVYLATSYNYGADEPANPFLWGGKADPGGVGRNLFCLFVQGCVGFIIVLIMEYKHDIEIRYKPAAGPAIVDEDEDVRRERENICSDFYKDVYALKIKDLTKVYDGRGCCRQGRVETRAVDRLCVGVRPGECFGLLGVNGAGKTTTFAMLTGKTRVTGGDAQINGASVLTEMHKVSRQIGYCPQFDALHGLLTGREELRFYARLKGVRSELVEKVVSRLIAQMGLRPHADRQSGTYSGGNKRKLSTAIALLGSPAVVLLDEPTTGMDPKARRFLWNRIAELVRDGKTSVVLTSHSMEECEALCGRIGIMVNGRFRCLGSNQHLKSRFGQGYTLTMKIGGIKPKTEDAVAFIKSRFPNVQLKEQHLSQLRFQLPPSVRALSDVFACMVEAMKVLHVDDYTLSQTTLEEVFLSFAQEQGDTTMGAASSAIKKRASTN